jgi:predicted DNA-binding transcriptional regulator AlpA
MAETQTIPQSDTLLVDKREAARLTGISTRSIDRLVSCGKFLPPVRLGGRTLWNRRALEIFAESGCVPDGAGNRRAGT